MADHDRTYAAGRDRSRPVPRARQWLERISTRRDTPSSATATTTSLFQFDGSGPSTTGPFTATGSFTFSYTLTCPEDLATPATFELLRAGRSIEDVASGVGSLQESGNQPDFGASGTFTVSVDAPATRAWTVSGDT